MTTVSICIVNWNCRDLLRACLRSLIDSRSGIRKNSDPDRGGTREHSDAHGILTNSATSVRLTTEVIVVDNASTDGAADMVAREFPGVRLIRNTENVGFARANNQAAQVAQGDYLFFLNNDTEASPDAVATLVDYLAENPDAVMAGPRLRGADGRLQVSHRRKPTVESFLHRTWLGRSLGLYRDAYREHRRQAVDQTTPHDVDVLLGAALMMRRRDFGSLGGWDEDFSFGGEDLELCHRAWQKGRVVHCPQAEILHHGSVSTCANASFAAPRIAAGFAKYFHKTGASRRQLLAYKLLVTVDAPVMLIGRTVHAVARRLTGRQRAATKSFAGARGAAAFLGAGLKAFWSA